MPSADLNLADFPQLDLPERILLGPGPSMVHPRILNIMSTPVIGHLDPLFLGLMDRTQKLLRYVFETGNSLTIPVSGTGSAAMEATLANLLEPGESALVCTCGYFGDRLVDMASRYTSDVRVVSGEWGRPIDPAAVEKALRERPAAVVAVVQSETSTGVFQSTAEIASIVHRQGGLLIADAVTSLGGMSVGVDRNGIDACYSCSQKCLSCPPGLGPLTLSPAAEAKITARKTKVTNWYLDLSIVQKYWGKERTYHHTAPITANYALYEGLRLVAEEGLAARFARHLANARMLWEGLGELGLECLVPLEQRLVPLTTVRVPDGVDEAVVRAQLLNDYNIEIAGGLGALKGKAWRIGLMGFSSRRENVLLLLAALKRILKR